MDIIGIAMKHVQQKIDSLGITVGGKQLSELNHEQLMGVHEALGLALMVHGMKLGFNNDREQTEGEGAANPHAV